VVFPQYAIVTTLSEPTLTLELVVDLSPTGEFLRLSYIFRAPMHKIAPPEVIIASGRDPNDITTGCWEEFVIDRPRWRRIIDKCLLRSFVKVVSCEAKRFHRRTLKDVRRREFSVEQARHAMKNLHTVSGKVYTND
jgi:hypothetical protein